MSPHFDPSVDLYATLGVDPDASATDIKKAYRKLAVQCHPDSTGGDKTKEARFKEISRAYEVLGDKKKRAQYDAMRAGAHRFTGGGGFGGGGAWDLGELFSQFFADGAPGQGAGARAGRSGFNFRSSRGGPFGDVDIFTTDRPDGAGRGRARAKPERRRERKVTAPDGSVLLQRGRDIHSDVRLGIDQAILGAVVEVHTLTGTAKVKVPPGTSSGVKLRLRAKGAVDEQGRGDHFVTIHIDVPRGLDDDDTKLLMQLMDRVRRKAR